jgi:membrane protein DedA with SNARE-associated domain
MEAFIIGFIAGTIGCIIGYIMGKTEKDENN